MFKHTVEKTVSSDRAYVGTAHADNFCRVALFSDGGAPLTKPLFKQINDNGNVPLPDKNGSVAVIHIYDSEFQERANEIVDTDGAQPLEA